MFPMLLDSSYQMGRLEQLSTDTTTALTLAPTSWGVQEIFLVASTKLLKEVVLTQVRL